MSVNADFSFLRRDVDGEKEWSVDISSTWYPDYEASSNAFQLHMLLECKYRSQQKTVILLPDPNEAYPQAILGATINSFDDFTPYWLPSDYIVELERKKNYAYKCVEIHGKDAVEKDLRHAIQQLRYATPALLRQVFEFNASNLFEEMSSLFFTKIIVTNAPLRILATDAGIDKIKNASTLDDISSPVDCAIIHSDFGPEYQEHFQGVFEPTGYLLEAKAREIQEHLKAKGKKVDYHSDPVKLVGRLINSEAANSVGRQFFITTLSGLPGLLDEICEACSLTYKKRTKTNRTPSKFLARRKIANSTPSPEDL